MGRKRKKPDYLSEREFICLEKYIECNNQKLAGESAGFSKRTASAQACRLINSSKGKRYLAERMSKLDSERIASANEVMEYLTQVMRGEIDDINFKTGMSQPVGVHERTLAGIELGKRLFAKDSNEELMVTIINDIPRNAEGGTNESEENNANNI